MKKIEKIVSALIIGCTFPLFLGLLSVISWFYFDRNGNRPLFYLSFGLVLGLIINYKFLKTWIKHRFVLPIWFMALIYLIYNILVYGFFMGLPVFNLFLGVFAGYYYGNRICFKNVESEKHSKLVNQVSLFTGLVMTLICTLSGILALSNNEAGCMIKEVLGLDFDISNLIIWGVVFIGGFILIFTNIILTRLTMIKIIKYNIHLNTFM